MGNVEKYIDEVALFIMEHSSLTELSSTDLAEDLYRAGYLKQLTGKWRYTGLHGVDFEEFKCSNCKKYTENGKIYAYCPHCGSPMKN